ncbi:ABC transporter substrate-binding protein [Ideonella azotifigens]|nr:ABC transporter substrate-binding protein [Ideonella azotifigens]
MQRRPLLIACLTAALGATLGIFTSTAALAQAPDWKKVRIGVEGAYPPFSEVGTDGKLKGFDIDMALALCAEMKAECTLVQQEWDGMIPALQAKKFDAIIASMAITEERKKAVAFTNKYYNTPARFVGKGSATTDVSPAGLKGKKIGVQRTTIHDRYVTAFYKDSEIVRYAKQDEVYLDMAAGRIDATLGDSVAEDGGFLKRPIGKGFAFIGPAIEDTKFFGDGSGIAIRKADTTLVDKFNAAIVSLRASGGYKKIQDKYFDFDVFGK